MSADATAAGDPALDTTRSQDGAASDIPHAAAAGGPAAAGQANWAGTGGPLPRTYEEALGALAAVRPDLIVMTAENRAAIRNLPPRLGDRFVDVGICEQTMIGAAAGLALRGRTPIAHALATFLVMRAFEFIRTDVGIGNLPVKLIGYVPGFLSDGNGPTHQALEDVALMRGIPHMQVVCPADEEELIAALPAILDSRSPCYVRFNSMRPAVTHTAPFEIGRAELLAAGAEGGVTLLTYGFLLREVEAARVLLEESGVPAALLNMRSLKPVDEAAVLAAARRSRLLVAVEDHFQTGGLYSIVAEVMVRHGVLCPLQSISLGERWFKPALLPDVLAHEGFTGPALAARVLAQVAALATPHALDERGFRALLVGSPLGETDTTLRREETVVDNPGVFPQPPRPLGSPLARPPRS